MSHTPGPWHVAYEDENRQSVVKGEHIEIAACRHRSAEEIEKEMHHNARLIAAAPELLEALKILVAGIDAKRLNLAEVEKARDVIKLATGVYPS